MAFNLQPKEKGKYFLVNDTYVRVDGHDWINLYANIGKLRAIRVATAMGKHQIHRPFCEGYVVDSEWLPYHKERFKHRCMDESELKEARSDSYFLRPNG